MGIDTVIDLIAKIGTTLAILYLGIATTRYVASVKEKISTNSDFNKKWADDFYKISSEYMRCIEKCASYLHFLNSSSDPNNKIGTKMQKEFSELTIALSEYDLSIRRFSFLSPTNKDELVQSSSDMLNYLTKIFREKRGNLDELISLQNRFNTCSRKAHAEMLNI